LEGSTRFNFKQLIMKPYIFLILALLTNSAFSQKTQVVATVGPETVTFEELEKAFQKNMNRKSESLNKVAYDSVKNFLELYTNYKLKVLDAIDRGFESDSAVKADIENNKRNLKESYYFDLNVLNPQMDYYMKERKRAVKFAYILIAYNSANAQKHYNSPIPLPDDSAYVRATEAFSKIKAGAKFEDIARQYSTDSNTAKDGGVVNQFLTVGKLQRDLDDAIFSLKKGEVYKEVIKNSYGYFILKLVDEEPRKLVKGSHILVSLEERTKEMALKRADSLNNLLKQGKSFESIAELHSDDSQSAMKGGSLGDWYGRTSGFEKTGSMLVSEFVDVLMSLKDGEVSRIVETPYGFHIIRRDSSKDYKFETDLDDVKKNYKRLHFEADKRKHIESLTKKYGFEINEKVFAELKSYLDSTKTNQDSLWSQKVPSNLLKEQLFKYKKMSSTVGDFILKSKSTQKYRGTPNKDESLRNVMKQMVEPLVLEDATMNLEKSIPELASLLKEFREGMLLFKVESEEVWDKLKFDSTKAKGYWDTTKTKYKTNLSYDISEIFVKSDSLAKEIKAKLDKGENFSDLATEYTVRSGYREKAGSHGILDSKKNKFLPIMDGEELKAGKLIGPKKFETGYSILKINSLEPIREKTFKEAISDFAPAYQEQQQKILLNTWLRKIQLKHKVKIDWQTLDKLLNKK